MYMYIYYLLLAYASMYIYAYVYKSCTFCLGDDVPTTPSQSVPRAGNTATCTGATSTPTFTAAVAVTSTATAPAIPDFNHGQLTLVVWCTLFVPQLSFQ